MRARQSEERSNMDCTFYSHDRIIDRCVRMYMNAFFISRLSLLEGTLPKIQFSQGTVVCTNLSCYQM